MKQVLIFLSKAFPIIALITSIFCLCGTLYFNYKINELRKDSSYAVEVKQLGDSFNLPFNKIRCYEDEELRKEVECKFKGDESNDE